MTIDADGSRTAVSDTKDFVLELLDPFNIRYEGGRGSNFR